MPDGMGGGSQKSPLYKALLQKAERISNPATSLPPLTRQEMPMPGPFTGMPKVNGLFEWSNPWGVAGELSAWRALGALKDHGNDIYKAVMRRIVPGAVFDDELQTKGYGDLQHSPDNPLIKTMR